MAASMCNAIFFIAKMQKSSSHLELSDEARQMQPRNAGEPRKPKKNFQPVSS